MTLWVRADAGARADDRLLQAGRNLRSPGRATRSLRDPDQAGGGVGRELRELSHRPSLAQARPGRRLVERWTLPASRFSRPIPMRFSCRAWGWMPPSWWQRANPGRGDAVGERPAPTWPWSPRPATGRTRPSGCAALVRPSGGEVRRPCRGLSSLRPEHGRVVLRGNLGASAERLLTGRRPRLAALAQGALRDRCRSPGCLANRHGQPDDGQGPVRIPAARRAGGRLPRPGQPSGRSATGPSFSRRR